MKTNYSYQDKAANTVINNALSDQYIASILAACPGAGKTTISQIILNKYTKQFPNSRILVLTEGKNFLKSQYLNELDNSHIKVEFTYGDFNSNAQVRVGLPQSIEDLEWKKIDLVLIDEAHNFYLADTVQSIIKKLNPKHKILMTGSPTQFNGKSSYAIHYIAAEELMESGVFSSVHMDVARCIDKKNPWRAMESVLTTAKAKRDDMSKIMVACPTIEYAGKVRDYLTYIGFSVSLSTSENDKNDSEILKFKNGETKVLIVVGKGILGFNDKKVTLLADLRSSSNLDASYQLFARVLRTHPEGVRKTYYRISDKDYNAQVLTLHKMTALMRKDIFKGFTGKNLKLAFTA